MPCVIKAPSLASQAAAFNFDIPESIPRYSTCSPKAIHTAICSEVAVATCNDLSIVWTMMKKLNVVVVVGEQLPGFNTNHVGLAADYQKRRSFILCHNHYSE